MEARIDTGPGEPASKSRRKRARRPIQVPAPSAPSDMVMMTATMEVFSGSGVVGKAIDTQRWHCRIHGLRSLCPPDVSPRRA